MKALYINTNDYYGGASIAARRHAVGLKRIGVSTKWYVKNSDDNSEKRDVVISRRYFLEKVLSRLSRHRVTWGPHFLSANKQLVSAPWWNSIDVLHLHNLHGDYFNYSALPKLTFHKPTVWTLHDIWSFTGHCATSDVCDRWKMGCGKCPDLEVYPGVKNDLTRVEWHVKKRAISRSKLYIVTPSHWLANLARQSFLSIHPIKVIPYGIDTDLYTPLDKATMRKELDLNPETFTVLMASADLKNPKKPQRVLCEALNRFVQNTGATVQLITFGGGSLKLMLDNRICVKECGLIFDDVFKCKLFSAADAFLFVSLGDNLPLVIQESLACGTPVIGNAIGGVPEMVINGKTGWLTDSIDVEAFEDKIKCAYTSSKERVRLSASARKFAEENYDLVEQAKHYKSIYTSLMNNHAS